MRRAGALATGPVAVAAALVALGCGHTETHRVAFQPARPPTSDVAVFVERVPERTYTEVGLVQVIAFGTEAEPPAVMAGLVREARRMGCDAIVGARLDQAGGMTHAIGVCAIW